MSQMPSTIFILVLALQQAAELAASRGASEDARHWQQLAATIQRAARDAFWVNGRWHDDLDQTTFSQLAAALALITRAVEVGEETAVLDALAARSLDPNDDHDSPKMVLASPYMHHRVFTAPAPARALRRCGRDYSPTVGALGADGLPHNLGELGSGLPRWLTVPRLFGRTLATI